MTDWRDLLAAEVRQLEAEAGNPALTPKALALLRVIRGLRAACPATCPQVRLPRCAHLCLGNRTSNRRWPRVSADPYREALIYKDYRSRRKTVRDWKNNSSLFSKPPPSASRPRLRHSRLALPYSGAPNKPASCPALCHLYVGCQTGLEKSVKPLQQDLSNDSARLSE